MRRAIGLVLAALLTAWFPLAGLAHEMSLAQLDVRETSKGEYIWIWSATNDKQPDTSSLRITWPAGCVAEENALHCGADGLQGKLAAEGLGSNYSALMVKVFWLDGQSSLYTLAANRSHVQLFGSADDRRGWGEIAAVYGVLGIEHILTGYDHLLFVIGLLFLVGFHRRLVWTITAFTAAHSLTLACAALGILTLRPPPVEATIALSIMLVAGEALHKGATLARRWPMFVAFLFGLVHGLGFAGALEEIGLPQAHLPVALFTFNAGVEIGQLVTVGLTLLVWLAVRRRPFVQRLRTPLLYGSVSLAAYCSWVRVASIFR